MVAGCATLLFSILSAALAYGAIYESSGNDKLATLIAVFAFLLTFAFCILIPRVLFGGRAAAGASSSSNGGGGNGGGIGGGGHDPYGGTGCCGEKSRQKQDAYYKAWEEQEHRRQEEQRQRTEEAKRQAREHPETRPQRGIPVPNWPKPQQEPEHIPVPNWPKREVGGNVHKEHPEWFE